MKKRSSLSRPAAENRTMAANANRNSLNVTVRGKKLHGGRAGEPNKSRNKKLRIAAIVAGSFLLVCAVAVYLVWRALTGNIHIVDPAQETLASEFNVPTESLSNPVPEEKGIVNILLLGVDTRSATSINERSDSMMILTIDEINGKIKLTSLQRDMLVYIPGRTDPNKINAANALGGPALALRVVNETLRLNITDYMIVNMRGMEKLIDLIGGVMIDVSDDEIPHVNACIKEENELFADTAQAKLLTKPGLQLLNGRQAVGYARVRHLDSDYKRMERQRTVMQALFTSFLKADLVKKGTLISQGLGMITTNISATKLTEIGLKTLPMMDGTIDQLQIPISGYFVSGTYNTAWCNFCDFNGMIPKLQQFIFGKTYSFDPVKEIPGAPNSSIKLPTAAPTKKPTPTPTKAPTATTEQTKTPTTSTLAPTTTTSGTTAATTSPGATTGPNDNSTKHATTTTASPTTTQSS